MMKVQLLLGSGVSIPSGVPSVDDITKSLLNSTWSRDPFIRYQQGECSWSTNTSRFSASPEQYLLSKVRDINDSIHKQSHFGRSTTYEDVMFLILLMRSRILGREIPLRVQRLLGEKEFIELKKQLAKAIANYEACSLGKTVREVEFLDLCERFIHEAVRNLLSKEVKPIGLEFVEQIVMDKELHSLTIATLNHDTLMEDFLSSRSIAYDDGFETTDSHNHFAPRHLLTGKVRLLKLHGSIDWFEDDEGNVVRCDEGNELQLRDKNDPFRLPFRFLCGSENKTDLYEDEPFITIHSQWSRLLEEAELMVISGYGGCDAKINDAIRNFVQVYVGKVVILHQEAELIEERIFNSSADRAIDPVRHPGILHVNKWMQDCHWDEVKREIEN